MIQTIYEIKLNAGNINFPLKPWNAFVGSTSSLRIVDLPKKIGSWEITKVSVEVKYPSSSIKTVECTKVGGVYVATIEAAQNTGTVSNGYRVIASGVDEKGQAVENYILGSGDVNILNSDRIVTPGTEAYVIYIYDECPTSPKRGDAYFSNGNLLVYDGSNWTSSHVTKTSQLSNDAGFITTDALSGYALSSSIPTKTSQLSNDNNFITDSDVDNTKILSKKTVLTNPQAGDKYIDAKGDVYMYVVETTYSPWTYSDSSTGHTLELNYNGVSWDWYDTGPDYGGSSMEAWMVKEHAERALLLSFDGFCANRTESIGTGTWKKVSCFNQNGYDVFVRDIRCGTIVLYFADGTTEELNRGMTDVAHNVVHMTIGNFDRGNLIYKDGFCMIGNKAYYFANKLPDIMGVPIREQMDFFLTCPLYIDTFATNI